MVNNRKGGEPSEKEQMHRKSPADNRADSKNYFVSFNEIGLFMGRWWNICPPFI